LKDWLSPHRGIDQSINHHHQGSPAIHVGGPFVFFLEQVKQGAFSQPYKLGNQITQWESDEIQQWMDAITTGQVQ